MKVRVAHQVFLRNKNYLYLAFLVVPAMPVVAYWLGVRTGQPDIYSLLSPLVFFGVIPVLDYLIGRDPLNPSEAELEPLRSSLFLNALPFVAAMVFVVLMIWGAWVFTHVAWATFWGPIAWTFGIGICGGVLGINVAHELIHKRGRLHQMTGGILLATVCYGTFKVEHLRGHHRWVATKDDPSTARAGQSVYQFLPKAMALNFVNAFRLEHERLRQEGRSVLSPRNELLWWNGLSVMVLAGLWAWLGAGVVAYFLGQALVAIGLLETVNYMEHYGLTRERLASGRFEPPDYRHSWNSDYLLSNLMLFQLQRHPDHHANATKPYQVLETIPASPQLPAGYATMLLIAWVPPLWRHIMDPRLAT